MANHLTPAELARELGLERREVIGVCLQRGIPILNGRIDRSLLVAELAETPLASAAGASRVG
jgi:hypothetical protein